jgi:hypothetical protein
MMAMLQKMSLEMNRDSLAMNRFFSSLDQKLLEGKDCIDEDGAED